MKAIEFTLKELEEGTKKKKEGWTLEAKLEENKNAFPYKITLKLTILGKNPKKNTPLTICLEGVEYQAELKEGLGSIPIGEKPDKMVVRIG